MNETKDRLLAVVTAEPRSRAELQGLAGLGEHDPQSIQRALRELVAAGLVRASGTTRNRLYFKAVLQPVAAAPQAAPEVPLSPGSRECLALLDQPLSLRPPVGYERAFLDGYRPGETAWLGPAVRKRLAALGQTPALAQPAGTWARQVLERFLLDLTWNSARLERNTYSLLDTERLLLRGEAAEGKDARETQMLLNHKRAIEYLVAEPGTVGINGHTVKALHALLMENLLANPLDEGALRLAPVGITGSAYLPLANPQLIDEVFRQVLLTAELIGDPFETSLFLLAHLPYLQPFADGNQRTARLAANLPFVLGNRVPLSFADVPRELLIKAHLAVYELRRVEPLQDVFLWAYERSAARLGVGQRSVGEPDPLRLQYRALLHEVVAEVVRAQVPPRDVEAALTRFAAQRVPPGDQPRFIAMAGVEVDSLHDGNFSRYGLRPSEFEAWQLRRR